MSDPTQLLAHDRHVCFPRYRLVVTDGPSAGLAVDGAAAELSVGTADANDLVLADNAVSRYHIAIAPTPRGHLVRDLGSTNGTSINGVLVERAFIAAGASIAIGQTRLRFEAVPGHERAPLSPDDRWGAALGSSDAMRRIFAMLPRLAASDATVLLEGETGTGKGLLARALHDASPRSAAPFVVVDCGAIAPNLIESELFGHEKGAFTGAAMQRLGAFEAAAGGTVFLDELGELPLDLQPKLLRALEERSIKRVGGNAQIELDIRVIAATNHELRAEVNRGRFRSDLYYRLNTFRVRVPPLRERREDIPLLVAHFHERLTGDRPLPGLIADLARRDWPGNVRELRAAVERAVVLGDTIEPAETPAAGCAPFETGVPFRVAKERAVAEWERSYLRTLLEVHVGNLSRAARAVQMDRNHLRDLLARHRVRTVEE